MNSVPRQGVGNYDGWRDTLPAEIKYVPHIFIDINP